MITKDYLVQPGKIRVRVDGYPKVHGILDLPKYAKERRDDRQNREAENEKGTIVFDDMAKLGKRSFWNFST